MKDKACKPLIRPQLEFASSCGSHGSNTSLTKLRKFNAEPQDM